MGWRRLVAGSVLAVMLGAMACSTFNSPDDVPGANDGGPEAAPIDGAVADTTNANDASTLARWCTTVDASFCADFDGMDIAEGWDGGAQIIGGSVGPDLDASTSAPRSMRSTVFAADASPHAAPLGKVFFASPAVARVAFRVLVPEVHPSTYAHLFAFRSYPRYPDGGPAQAVQLALGLSNGVLLMKEEPLNPLRVDAGPIDHPITSKLDTGAWIGVDLAFHFGANARFEVKVDGTLVLTQPMTISRELPSAVVVYLGLYAEPSSSDWVANFDDFVFEL